MKFTWINLLVCVLFAQLSFANVSIGNDVTFQLNDCDCDWEDFSPVCVETEIDGEVTSLVFTNACFAECEGYTDYVDCGEDNGGDNGGDDNDTDPFGDLDDLLGGDCDCDWTDVDPVCVTVTDEDGNTSVMPYSNACYAECDGYTEYESCDLDDVDGNTGGDGNPFGGGEDCDCEEDLNPVCVETEIDGEAVSLVFSNACYAECNGYTDYTDCGGDNGGDDGAVEEGTSLEDLLDIDDLLGGDCDCDWTNIDPVCVTVTDEDGNTSVMPYPNACYAECDGYTEYESCDLGDVDGNTGGDGNPFGGGEDCDCEEDLNPVCVETEIDGEAVSLVFSNACYAECNGYTDYTDCGGDNGGDDTSVVEEAISLDELIGMDELLGGECGCDWTDIDPVCVTVTDEDGNTSVMPYPNACYAECDGYTEYESCDLDDVDGNTGGDGNPFGGGEDCDCEEDFNPVCVETEIDGEAVSLVFSNACYAECNGYTDYNDCGDGNEQIGAPTFLQSNTTTSTTLISNVSVAPNPVYDVTTIEFTTGHEGECQITIVGIDGRTVSSQSIQTIQGTNTHAIDATNIQSGIYLINITDRNNSTTVKMIKQ